MSGGVEPIMMEAAAKRFSMITRYKLKNYFKAELPPEDYQTILEAVNQISERAKEPRGKGG